MGHRRLNDLVTRLFQDKRGQFDVWQVIISNQNIHIVPLPATIPESRGNEQCTVAPSLAAIVISTFVAVSLYNYEHHLCRKSYATAEELQTLHPVRADHLLIAVRRLHTLVGTVAAWRSPLCYNDTRYDD